MNKLYEFRSYEDAQMLIESSSDGNSMLMSGIFVQGDVQNHNKRVYPVREINSAVGAITERISKGETVLGELDHPEELSINLDRVSHIISKMWMDGCNGMGTLKIIPTPTGEIVKTLLQSGAKLGVSSRGSGNVDDYGNVSEFDMVTVDIVAQPSAPNAYPRTIYESLFNMKGGSHIFEMARGVTQGDIIAQRHLDKNIIKFINDLKI